MAVENRSFDLGIISAICDCPAPAMNGKRSYLSGILVILIFNLFAPATQGVPEPAFGPPAMVSFTNNIAEFRSGDFDNDGKDDLLVQTSKAGQPPRELILLSCFEGGAFKNVLSIPLTNQINVFSTGDINNDDNLDILLLDGSTNECDRYTVLSGDGMGGFSQVQVVLNTPIHVRYASLNDIDGDGNADFVASGSANHIFMGRGDGLFDYWTNFLGAGGPIVLENLNLDRRPDLLNGGYHHSGSGFPTVSVSLNMGDGRFRESQVYVTNSPPGQYHMLLAADFNGDARADLATVLSGSVALRLNNGNGTFGPSKIVTNGSSSFTLQSTDFNGDGNLDLLSTSLILLGNGDGTFVTFTNFGPNERRGGVGDFNGDKKPDVVYAPPAMLKKLAIHLNETKPAIQLLSAEARGSKSLTFTNPIPTSFSTPQAGAKPIAVDLNRDGAPDVLTFTSGSPYGVGVLLNDGIGGLGPFTNFPMTSLTRLPMDTAVGDFNNDGKQDLILTHGWTNLVLMAGDGRGRFTQSANVSLGTTYGEAIVAGYFDGDDNLDLVVGSQTTALAILAGHGNGTFSMADILPFKSTHLAAGDFNSDGVPDILVSDGSVLIGNGDGTFQPAGMFPSGATRFLPADFDDDGDLDFAMRTIEGSWLLLGDGKGNFTTNDVPDNTPFTDVGDFDMDGHVDLIGTQNARLAVLRGVGDGTFVTYIHTNWFLSGDLTAVDLNMDEKPDFVKVEGGTLVRYFNQSPWPISPPVALGGKVKVQWPAWSGFVLESTTNIALVGSWSPVTNEFGIQSRIHVMTNQLIDENRFYRLGTESPK